jgi:hypothetical protein
MVILIASGRNSFHRTHIAFIYHVSKREFSARMLTKCSMAMLAPKRKSSERSERSEHLVI